MAGNVWLLSQEVSSATGQKSKPLIGDDGAGLPGTMSPARPAR